jgi:hypothetical protein
VTFFKEQMPYVFILLLTLAATCMAQTPFGTLSGQVTDKTTGNPLSGCSVSIKPSGIGTTSDTAGTFSLSIPYGSYRVEFSYVGYETAVRKISLSASHNSVRLNQSLSSKIISLGEVTVLGEEIVAPPTVQRIEQIDLSRIPTVYNDALRSIQILPGVASNNELSSAYNVRGGNFEENLIYLNGYEINRPLLLRQGIEENQSLINPDMVDGIRFYDGAFPAYFGDKLSSALEVTYLRDQSTNWGGSIHANLLNQSLSVHKRSGNLNWCVGLRYSNPNIFVNTLQTSGTYRPQFADVQLLANYVLPHNSRVEFFGLQADNRFRLTPKSWSGHFAGINYMDVKAIELRFQGKRTYTDRTGLFGLKYDKVFAPKTRLSLALSRGNSTEREDADLTSQIYYNENAWYENNPLDYLKSRLEYDHDRLDLTTYEIQPQFQFAFGKHSFVTGMDARFVHMKNRTDEFFQEIGDSSIQEIPRIKLDSMNMDLNSVSGFVHDMIQFNEYFRADGGLRLLHYEYNNENLLSPRFSLHAFPDEINTVNFSWGYYYQPPFYHEVSANLAAGTPRLKAQRAIHYVLGWEHEFRHDLTLEVETYYKKLDRLIPFYLDQAKLEYGSSNSLKGYATGFDVLLRGRVTKDINSWISYSYLSTKEKNIDGSSYYQRRLLDQTHTLRFFLQDKMPKLPNVQVHNRMLFGSGYLYYPEKVVSDKDGNKSMVVDFNHRYTYPFYFRADIGFTARIKLGKRSEMMVIAEVLNAFNRANVASYSWFPIYPSDPTPTKVPQVLSDRFFNVGVELKLE